MSVSVSKVSKLYGAQKALDDVSFEIQPGEILGFLGPNGAGKSTMMKIITTYIPQEQGQVKVCGFDTALQAMDVRRNVGYLPEHNPLYLDMYVREYLEFIAGLHRISTPRKRVRDMISMTGLGAEQHKKIGALSKGYRQRVGLAQAMIHDPKVLILDEPTSGLDPNQLAEIRTLIRSMGTEKTVMLSTHIMQEVEAVCDRVVIINKGKLVADSNAAALRKDQHATIVTVEFDKQVSREELLSIAGVERVHPSSGNSWLLYADKDRDIRPDVFRFAVEKSLTVLTISRSEQRLEEIFRELTRPA